MRTHDAIGICFVAIAQSLEVFGDIEISMDGVAALSILVPSSAANLSTWFCMTSSSSAVLPTLTQATNPASFDPVNICSKM